MQIPLYQIDAFTSQVFRGNPAAVCPLTNWLPDSTLQAIAAENNLSETAFFVPTASVYHIRWFTPSTEVELCGHATLASAYVIFNILKLADTPIAFDSLSGILTVYKAGDQLRLDFPALVPEACDIPQSLLNAFNPKPIACLRAMDYIAIFDNENKIQDLEINFSALEQLDLRGVIVTAPGSTHDFVSRFFAPNAGIQEDPVTGSAYTQLTPYWSDKFAKQELSARQLSARGGELHCHLEDDRVHISGSAVLFLEGQIHI